MNTIDFQHSVEVTPLIDNFRHQQLHMDEHLLREIPFGRRVVIVLHVHYMAHHYQCIIEGREPPHLTVGSIKQEGISLRMVLRQQPIVHPAIFRRSQLDGIVEDRGQVLTIRHAGLVTVTLHTVVKVLNGEAKVFRDVQFAILQIPQKEGGLEGI